MKKTFSLFALAVAAAILFTQCGGNASGYEITEDGLGPLTFTAETVDFGKGYEVKSETYEDEMDGYIETTITILKDGHEVASRKNDYRIEVMSPEFKTKDGLHAGMDLSEAVQILGEEYNIWNYNDDTYFYFAKPGSKISVIVDGDSINGGFDNYYMRPFELTFGQFAADTKVKAVVIENN